MKSFHEEYLITLNKLIDKEINDLTEILGILGDSGAVTNTDNLNLDIQIMTARRASFKSVKGMIKKTSIQVVGVDKEVIMSSDEKKVFYKLVRVIMFFRKLFKKNK